MLHLDQHRQPHDLHVELLHLAAHLPLLFKQRRDQFLQHLQDLCLRDTQVRDSFEEPARVCVLVRYYQLPLYFTIPSRTARPRVP